jgi:hypothetical protein
MNLEAREGESTTPSRHEPKFRKVAIRINIIKANCVMLWDFIWSVPFIQSHPSARTIAALKHKRAQMRSSSYLGTSSESICGGANNNTFKFNGQKLIPTVSWLI